MGIVEGIIAVLMLIGSAGYNVKQAGEIGALEVERDRYKQIADAYATDGSRKLADVIADSDERSSESSRAAEHTEAFRHNVIQVLSLDDSDCASRPAGDSGRSLVDEHRRFVEELYRVPAEP